MWLILGIGAIVFAILNVIWTCQGENSKWFCFTSLSLTALTVCAFYSDGARRVLNKDWGGLEDIMPTISGALWILVIISILINCISLLKNKN